MSAGANGVLLALSGGVDSAVAARLLQQQGHDVQGLVIRFSPAHEGAVAAAQTAAKELGIPLTVADAEAAFEENVALPFCRDYAAGRTPNPCVVCNPIVKFAVLARRADELGLPFIATGHYARLVRQDGLTFVATAKSEARDQSYMLYRLPQAILGRLLLPLAQHDKTDIRALATSFGLSAAAQPDSQEICFIPDGDYAAYITQKGFANKPGSFLSPSGQPLGAHSGVIHYTVGQRRGLGLAMDRPVYVDAILPNGDVQLAYHEDTFAAALTLRDVLTADGAPFDEAAGYLVKIRSMAKAVPCQVRYHESTPTVIFDNPQRAPAPGQHAVLYRRQTATDAQSPLLVAGGGVIDTVTKAQKPEVAL